MINLKKKIIFSFSLFLFFSTNSYSNENLVKINTLKDKLNTIQSQLDQLKQQQQELEKLQAKFEKDVKFLEKQTTKKPKIALVLSGGGAKGAAEIGVIETLEKLNIPIDYIVGTSAGSIVGAMYSVGYSAKEMRDVINNLNFQNLLLSDGERALKPIVEKNRNKYPLTVSVNPSTFDVALPTGITDGEEVYLQLKDIFSRAEGIHDFSKLPINFTAISTNLQTGDVEKLQSGDLALATFKSMAIPTFLVPVEDKGKFYVDGGVVDNFAIYEAIKMGADIIIAVNISAEPTKITSDSNIITILDKLASYRGDENVKKQIGYADILITPDVRKKGTLNFSDLDNLISLGREAGNEAATNLAQLSDKERFNEIKIKKERLKPEDSKIEKININTKNEFVVEDIKKLKPSNEYFTQNDLNLWAQKVYSLNYIDRVFYDVDKETDTINFNVVENFDSKLQGGISYLSEYGASLQLAAEIPNFGKTKKKNVFKAELSKYPKIAYENTQLFNYFDNTFETYLELMYSENPLFMYSKDKINSTYTGKTFGSNIYLGTSLFEKLFLGYSIGYKKTSVDYSEGEHLEDDKVNDISLDATTEFITNTAFLYMDTLDSNIYPTSGGSMVLSGFDGKSLDDSNKKFSGYSYSANYYKSFYKKLTVGATINSGNIKRGDYTPLLELFSLGGLRDMTQAKDYGFYGLPLMGIYTDKFLMAQGTLRYSLIADLNLIFKYNVATLDSITNNKYSYGDNSVVGYGGGIAWNTFLGPIELVLSNNVLGDGALFQAHIGYTF